MIGEQPCKALVATESGAPAERSKTHTQAMSAHESPRTTKLFDRTRDEITLDEVERIAI